DWTSTDDLEAVLSDQRQFIRQGRLYIDGRLSGGRWFEMKDVRIWRERTLRSCSLLIAFRVMFLASVIAESGPLWPSYPD
ncbi:MAG TPA: hypothetical protein PLC39_04965, partial [Methanomassiliicoccales archaeon]|nr:hypothetical protein [Methanomassiliicoccales archaeon]